jgi:3-oxoadipate enol-lactonase
MARAAAFAPPLPPGRRLELPRRGTTFIREAAGPPGAPTVVLLHGWTASADLNWFPSYGPLSREFHVVAIDNRGHGRGIRSLRPFRLEDCADDVDVLCDVLGLNKVVAVGYSMGGPIAQLLWRRHPERVAGLVLCATARRFSGSSPGERAMWSSMFGLSMAARLTPDVLRQQVFERIMGGRLEGSPAAQWAADEVRRGDPATILQAGTAIGRFDSRAWIGDVDVPTSVVVTDLDQLVAPRSQMNLANSIPGASVRHVRGNHGVCVMGARLFVPALVDACREVSRRAVTRPAQSTARL